MPEFADTEPTVPGQLSALKYRVFAVEQRLGAIVIQLAENTELTRSTSAQLGKTNDMTRDILDALTFGRFFTRLLKWAGGLALAATAIYAAVQVFIHGKSPL